LGYNKPIIYDNERPGDLRRLVGSANLAKDLINFSSGIPIEEGIKHTVDWYKQFAAL